MNIHDLEAFIAVAETGSIGAAAVQLNITQPGVTRRVQSLELAVGTALLDRRTKPPRLTTAGRAAYEHARRVSTAVKEMTLALEPAGEPSGEFRIGVSVGLGDLALSDPLDRVRAAYPKLHLRATANWNAAQQVRDGTLDAAAVLWTKGNDLPAGLIGERLAKYTAVIVAGRSLKLPASRTIGDFAAIPWVLNHEGCVVRRAIADALTAHKRSLVPGVEVAGGELQLSLIARGHGLGVVLPRMLERSAFRDAVRIIKVRGFQPVFEVLLVHGGHPGRLAEPIRTFRDALKDQLP